MFSKLVCVSATPDRAVKTPAKFKTMKPTHFAARTIRSADVSVWKAKADPLHRRVGFRVRRSRYIRGPDGWLRLDHFEDLRFDFAGDRVQAFLRAPFRPGRGAGKKFGAAPLQRALSIWRFIASSPPRRSAKRRLNWTRFSLIVASFVVGGSPRPGTPPTAPRALALDRSLACRATAWRASAKQGVPWVGA